MQRHHFNSFRTKSLPFPFMTGSRLLWGEKIWPSIASCSLQHLLLSAVRLVASNISHHLTHGPWLNQRSITDRNSFCWVRCKPATVFLPYSPHIIPSALSVVWVQGFDQTRSFPSRHHHDPYPSILQQGRLQHPLLVALYLQNCGKYRLDENLHMFNII